MNSLCATYDIEYDKIRSFVEEHGVRRALIQAPDGLKPLIRCIIKALSDTIPELIVSGSPTYGACDLALDEARVLGAEAIIHIGHNEYPHLAFVPEIPVLYIPAYYKLSPSISAIEELSSLLRRRGFSSIGLASTIQHVKALNIVEEELKRRGFEVYVGESKGLMRGQVLGCNYTSAVQLIDLVDAYVLLASGAFHALGLALATSKPVILLDPYRDTAIDYTSEAERIFRTRIYVVSRMVNSLVKTIGIIVGSLPGQHRPEIVEQIARAAMDMSIEPFIITSKYLHLENLIAIDNALNLDAYVVTSCPRLPIDDLSSFYKPVLTPGEFLMIHSWRESGEAPIRYRYPW